jgi:methylmalonyl-CoA/ethylmalonyl-CoA epimerase
MDQSEIRTKNWQLTQVGVVVRDMDQAIARLQELGFGPFEERVLSPDREEWFRGEPFHGPVKISMADAGNVELELIQPMGDKGLHREYLDEKGEGIQHVKYAVDDFDKEVAELTEKGAEVVLRANMQNGRRIAYVDLKIGGLFFELVQKGT